MCDNGTAAADAVLQRERRRHRAEGVPRPLRFRRSKARSRTPFRFLDELPPVRHADYATGFKRLDNNLRIRCQIFYTCLEYVAAGRTPIRGMLAQMQSNGTLRDFVDQRREVREAPRGVAVVRRARRGSPRASARRRDAHGARRATSTRGRRTRASIPRASSSAGIADCRSTRRSFRSSLARASPFA